MHWPPEPPCSVDALINGIFLCCHKLEAVMESRFLELYGVLFKKEIHCKEFHQTVTAWAALWPEIQRLFKFKCYLFTWLFKDRLFLFPFFVIEIAVKPFSYKTLAWVPYQRCVSILFSQSFNLRFWNSNINLKRICLEWGHLNSLQGKTFFFQDENWTEDLEIWCKFQTLFNSM